MKGLRRWTRTAYDRLVARRPALFDLAPAAVTTAVEVGLYFNGGTPVGLVPIAVTVLTGPVLLVRRRAPWAALIAAGASAALLVALGYSPNGSLVVVALAFLTDLRERRVSLAAMRRSRRPPPWAPTWS